MQAAGQGRFTPRLALAALYLLGVSAYVILGSRQVIPSISPDEFTYGHLARSIAGGDGLSWRGENVPLRSALYLYTIAPAWLIGSPTSAYHLAKAEGALLICTVVLPTWLLARRAVGPWVALLPAGLAILGTWMLATAGILTENLAYPLATAALAATVMALIRPASRWPWVAIGLTALAALSRSQLAVLVVVLPLAGMLDALRLGRGAAGERFAERRTLMLASGGLAVVGAAALLLAPGDVLGAYAGLQDYSPSPGDILSALGRHAAGLIALTGVVPAVVLLASSIGARAWRDEHLGPMLCVFWVAATALTVQVAWYTAGAKLTWHIERYLEFVVPLALTIMVVAAVRARPGPRIVVAVAVAMAAALLLAPPIRNVSEEEAVFGISRVAHTLLGTSAGLSLALVALAAGAAAVVVLARVDGRNAATIAVAFAGFTGVVFVVQDLAAWSWRIDAVHEVRADRPADLRWLDHAASGPVARIAVATTPASSALTEFFNEKLEQVYVPAPQVGTLTGAVIHGRTCTWNASKDGVLGLAPGCGKTPLTFLLDDEVAKLTLAGQRVIASERRTGARLVTLPRGTAPRLLALVNVPCGPRQFAIALGNDGVPRKQARAAACTPALSGTLWLDRAGTLELRFRGGVSDQHLLAGGVDTAIPAGRTTLVRVAAPKGATTFEFQLGWTGTGPENPELTRFDLVRGTSRIDLMGS